MAYKSRKIKERRISYIFCTLSGLWYCIDVGRVSEFPRTFLLTLSRPAILAKLSESFLVDTHLQCFYFLLYYHILTKPSRSLSFGHQMALQTGTVSAGHQTAYRFFGMRKREIRHGISWCVTSCGNPVHRRPACHWHILMDNWRAKGHFRAMK